MIEMQLMTWKDGTMRNGNPDSICVIVIQCISGQVPVVGP